MIPDMCYASDCYGVSHTMDMRYHRRPASCPSSSGCYACLVWWLLQGRDAEKNIAVAVVVVVVFSDLNGKTEPMVSFC